MFSLSLKTVEENLSLLLASGVCWQSLAFRCLTPNPSLHYRMAVFSPGVTLLLSLQSRHYIGLGPTLIQHDFILTDCIWEDPISK